MLIFGSIFLAAKLVDVIVSSFDVFNWIGYLQNTCKFFNQTDSTTSSNGPYVWLFFVLSVLLTFIFTIVVFCSYRLKTKEETKAEVTQVGQVEKTKEKTKAEVTKVGQVEKTKEKQKLK